MIMFYDSRKYLLIINNPCGLDTETENLGSNSVILHMLKSQKLGEKCKHGF